MSALYHFTGASLPPEFTGVTAGSGAIVVTDGYVELSSPSTTDAAFFYLNTPINRSVSQLIVACVRVSTLAATVSIPMWLADKATAPVAEPGGGAFNPRRIIGWSYGDGVALTGRYWDSGGTQQKWDTGGSAFSTGGVHSIDPVVVDDFALIGLEIDADGGNSRFRFVGGCAAGATFGSAKNQGMVLNVLSDWVNWSATQAIANNLYLIFGDVLTDGGSGTLRFEWIRHATGTREPTTTNGKDDGGSYGIARHWGYDGQLFLPEDRSSRIVTGDVKDPAWIDDGAGTVHLFHRTNGTGNIIQRWTASSAFGSFSDQGAIITAPSGHAFAFPFPIHTPWEGPGYEWQMLLSDGPSNSVLRLFTNSGAGGTWTDRGVVLNIGTGGDADATAVTGAVIKHRNGMYEVWYTGISTVSGVANVQQTGMRAIGAGLTSAGGGLLALVKDGFGARLPRQDQVEVLLSNLSGNTASVASTAGFLADMPIYFDQNATDSDWVGSRARKIVANSSIEAYFRAMGLLTSSGAKVYGALNGNQQIRDIRQVGSEWWVYVCIFNFAKLDGTFSGFQEENALLIVPAGTDLANMSPSHYAWQHWPITPRNTFGFGHSNENIAFLQTALLQSAPLNDARIVFGVAA